jgi:RNA-directed DNA polymerase
MAVKAKVRTVTRKSSNQSLPILIHRMNPMLRGWANYHRHGASAKTFSYLAAFTWRRVWYGLCHKHPKDGRAGTATALSPDKVARAGRGPTVQPATVAIMRYRYQVTAIASPWATTTQEAA